MVSEDEKRFLSVLAEMAFPNGLFGECVIEQRLGSTCTGCQFTHFADCHFCCTLKTYRERTAKDNRKIRVILHEYPELRNMYHDNL